jgi:hypothetical protein
MTPAISNTQIKSCLTVEFNRVSSFSGLIHPIQRRHEVPVQKQPAAGRLCRDTALHIDY